MSTALKQQNMDDYLQESALHYLQRRQNQPESESALFKRAVEFLERTTGHNQARCENAVARAYGELRAEGDRRYLDIDVSNANTIVIADPETDRRYVIPVRRVVEQFIDRPLAETAQ